MNPRDFEAVATLVYKECGLVLPPDKAYLVSSRLAPVARKWHMNGVEDVAAALRGGPSRDLVRDVVDAMVTNESFFFRDKTPFDQFKDIVLPGLLAARAATKTIRVWSAACSSGQEPYTLAMILKEMAPRLAGWRIEILATDISSEILERARKGTYTQFEVQRGLPIQLLVKYFAQDGDQWAIDPALRGMVRFQSYNLLADPRPLGRFDVVFCRNVLIYFDQPTKSRILDGIAEVMPPDGTLYLGGAETVLGLTQRFERVAGQRGMYAPAAQAPTGLKRLAG